MLVTPNNFDPVAKIKVVGVGGGGGNTVDTMIKDYVIDGVEFYAFNTDAQALKKSMASVTLQMGDDLTRGLGVGGDHTLGAQAAEASLDQIHEHLAGADMVFITAGMGGGTGTGAAPVVAGVSKNLGALTVAVVTTPFKFEGRHRESVAVEGLNELKDKVDTLIVVPNQRLIDIIDDQMSFLDAMKEVDRVLAEGVKSISSLVTTSGFINVDFADVKSIMKDAGTALMGIGRASGAGRAEAAARQATNSPLLNMSIEGAKGVLFNIVGGTNMSMNEINTAAGLIEEAVDKNAKIIFGAMVDESLNEKDELIITIVATGFDENKQLHTSVQKGVTPVTLVQPTREGGRAIADQEYGSKDDMGAVVTNDYSTPIQSTPQHTPFATGVTRSSDRASVQDDDTLDVPAYLRRQ